MSHYYEEEVRIALEQPIQVNLTNIHYYAAYYRGALAAMRMCFERYSEQVTAKERPYIRASLELASKSPRYTEMFMQGQPIRYRNHVKKGNKVVSVEAYFFEEVKLCVEVE